MLSRIALWVLVIIMCVAAIAALVIVIGLLADQTGEASPLQNQGGCRCDASTTRVQGCQRRPHDCRTIAPQGGALA
jgi:hypothetical protein